jgi:hypothetical protein
VVTPNTCASPLPLGRYSPLVGHHSHDLRVHLGGVTICRIQCTTCRAGFTVLPHFGLRYRHRHPEVARNALLATHGELSLALCAVIWHISSMALYRLACAFGYQSLVAVLTRRSLPLPAYCLADEKHSRCLTEAAGRTTFWAPGMRRT